ncbi:MAG: hypothetical protein Q9195_006195 [Heterodermia aff. obscurata]
MSWPKQSKKGQAAKKAQIEKSIQDAQKQAPRSNATYNKKWGKGPYKAGARKLQVPYEPLHKSFPRSEGPEIHVHLPAPPVNPLVKSRARGLPKSTAPLVSTLSPVDIESDSKRIPVWLPETKRFPFMDLPAEIRVKIYRYFFKPANYKIQFISRKFEALTYTLPDRPRCEDPKVPTSAMRRRRQFDYPRRVRSKETDIPPYELMPGPCALLLAHPRIGCEAAEYFYKLQTFSFSSCRVLNAFMDMLPLSSKQAITDVRLRHYTAGWSRWNYIEFWHVPDHCFKSYLTEPFKIRNDYRWEDTLLRLSDEMCNLEKLSLDETINDMPMEVHEMAKWRQALSTTLCEMPKMMSVNIRFRSHQAKTAVLEVEAYKLEQELLAEPYRDSNDAIEYVSDTSKPEKLLPPEKRKPVKCIRLLMPGYERPLY